MTLPVCQKHIMILTGEPSGDTHAAKLVRQVKKINPHIYFSGIGGKGLKDEQVDIFFDIQHLSAMGLTEVIAQFGNIRRAFKEFKKKLAAQLPDLIILVDYPGFNLRAAQFAKKHYNVPILYYIAPKVWAWNKKRLIKIRKFIDHVALIFPFEEKIYAKAGIPSTYVGNPLMDEYPENETRCTKRHKPGTSARQNSFTIGLLPGSRRSEIKKILPTMVKAARMIAEKYPKSRFIISKVSFIEDIQFQHAFAGFNPDITFITDERPVKYIFEKTDLVIAASGTVTLEAALACVPTILVYKMSEISYRLARLLVKLEFAGLANLIVNKEVMPELLQHDVTPVGLCNTAVKMIQNLAYHEKQLALVRKFLGTGGTSKRAATIAVQMIK